MVWHTGLIYPQRCLRRASLTHHLTGLKENWLHAKKKTYGYRERKGRQTTGEPERSCPPSLRTKIVYLDESGMDSRDSYDYGWTWIRAYPLPASFLTIAKTTVGKGCRDSEKTGGWQSCNWYATEKTALAEQEICLGDRQQSCQYFGGRMK